jgi:hypothetical protein
MDAEDPFKGCWDRYDRAIAHRQEALEVWNEFVSNEDAYSVGLYVDTEGDGSGRGTLTVRQNVPMPSLLPILFGEYFYNLRAAMDYAVYATAIIDNGWQDPPPGERVLQFPICETPEAWLANAYRVAPLSERHRGWIESVQPYMGTDEPRERGIYWLNHFARLDRHRELRVVGGYLAEANPIVHAKPGTAVMFERMDDEIFVEDGTVIARFTITPWAEGDEIEANPQMGIDIELKDFFLGRPPDTKWLRMSIKERLFLIETVIHSEVGRLEYDCIRRTRSKFVDTDWPGFKQS